MAKSNSNPEPEPATAPATAPKAGRTPKVGDNVTVTYHQNGAGVVQREAVVVKELGAGALVCAVPTTARGTFEMTVNSPTAEHLPRWAPTA